MTNYSGTTYVTYGQSSSESSNTNSCGGTPERYGKNVTYTTDNIRVPTHEKGNGQVKKINRSGSKYDVTVVNHGCTSTDQ